MSYELIAFDMDGTLLTSKHDISLATVEAIKKATSAGKHVCISTGRCLGEIRQYFSALPDLHYIISNNGAMVYDVRADKPIYTNPIPADKVTQIFQGIRDRDTKVQILGVDSIVPISLYENMDHYGMSFFRELFRQYAVKVEDTEKYALDNPQSCLKINVYHTDEEEREKSMKALADLGLISVRQVESPAIEYTAPNTSKGTGLHKLCQILNIPVESTIAVGDSYNDMEMLKAAGLAVAMGNALPGLKDIADVVVADNNHDGCAEAIEKYLLK